MAFLGLVCCARLAIAENGPSQITSLEGITEYRLENGLTVLLYPDDSRPTVTVNLTVMVGSRHEGYGETGMAHLLEHMLFKGTPTHDNIIALLQERGASFNGTTWVDRTNYYETLPAGDENLEFAIRLEADRFVNSRVSREDLLSEMTVVRNEFEAGENNPVYVLMQRMMAVAYEWHNYGKSTIGNRSDIERVPIENLQAFYKKYYQPGNAVLVVAGRFDEDLALELIEKYFGAIPASEQELPQTYTEEPAQDGERRVILRRVGDVGVASVLYHTPAGPHPNFAALQILDEILTAEPAGRLYKSLVEKNKASAVMGMSYGWHDPGVYHVIALVRDPETLEEVNEEMIAQIESVGEEGVTEEEVERARTRILSQRELAAADTTQIAIEFSQWASQGDWRLYLLHRDRIEKVTSDQVQQVAKQYFRRNNRTVGFYYPTESAARVEIPETPNVADLLSDYQGREAIVAGEEFDPSLENIENRTQRDVINDGLTVSLLPKQTRGQTVVLRLTLRYGNEENLKSRVNAGEFLPSLMLRGTEKYNYQELKDQLDKNRAVLTASSGLGSASFSLQTKREFLPPILELLQQVFREPSLSESELEILKQDQLASLEQLKTDPQGLAPLNVRRRLSPYETEDVRYVPTIEEEVERVKSVNIDDVRLLYGFLGGDQGELAVVGDFDPTVVREWASGAFTEWERKQPYERVEYRVFPEVASGKEIIETPDKSNAVYFAGQTYPMRDDDPDYPAMVLGNYVLGGSPSARLFERVRQKDGLSYGIGSGFSARSLDPRAAISIFAISNPENAEKVAAAVREEIDLLLKDGIPAEELEKARQGYLQSQHIDRSEDSSVASMLNDAAFADRSLEFDARVENRIEELTADEILTTLRKYIDPDTLVISIAGDFADVAADASSE